MSKQRSLAAYRAIDLTIWGLILFALEFMIVTLGAGIFSGQYYIVSVTCGICCITYMRWGWWGALHAVIGGVSWCLANSFSGGLVRMERAFSLLQFLLIYAGGNLLSLLTVPFIKRFGTEKLRKSRFIPLLLAAVTLLLMHLGRMAFAMILGLSAGEALAYLTTDSLSYVFTVLIVLAARKADGLYEEQTHYLVRFQKEEALREEQL